MLPKSFPQRQAFADFSLFDNKICYSRVPFRTCSRTYWAPTLSSTHPQSIPITSSWIPPGDTYLPTQWANEWQQRSFVETLFKGNKKRLIRSSRHSFIPVSGTSPFNTFPTYNTTSTEEWRSPSFDTYYFHGVSNRECCGGWMVVYASFGWWDRFNMRNESGRFYEALFNTTWESTIPSPESLAVTASPTLPPTQP